MPAEIKTKEKFTVREICYISVCTALIAACSQILVPLAVPFTLQTFAVFFALDFLGGRNGFFAVLVYIILGIAGAPVFGEFTSGIGIVAGITGGYITGFLLAAAAYNIITGKFGVKIYVKAIAMAIGLIACYAAGTAQFVAVSAGKGEPMGVAAALGLCVFPFIIPDAVKISLAVMLSERIKKYVG